VPVGKEIPDLLPGTHHPYEPGRGSIIVVAATDAPLLPNQLKRIARRIPLGIGRTGGMGGNSSGDIFIAFSTANPKAARQAGLSHASFVPNASMNPLFHAVVHATEEAIVNALVAAETMQGMNGNTVYALPHDRLLEIMKKYNRLGIPCG
jgi:L-aminopeptidase/D-esterase-like protein